MNRPRAEELVGEAWGGLAAMLVALPSSIAFGVAVFTPLGASWIGAGALAGLVGVVAMGVVAAAFGGTPRLVSSPCAPAAAVMAALAAELLASGQLGPEQALVLMTLAALLSGALQVAYGAIGAGKLIKFIPYPVVTGYLSGVGLIIIRSQLPKFFAWPKATALFAGLSSPALWQGPAVVVGLATVAAMLLAPRLSKKIPAPILAVASGVAAYLVLGRFRPELRTLAGNPLVIGPLPLGGASLLDGLAQRWASIGKLGLADLKLILGPALTLSALLSIDTLKTCVVIDALTRSRHQSNRELVGQGLGNLASALAGGVPGAGGMGVTLVNISGGGRTRLSSVLAGVFALGAVLTASGLIAWLPISALAGILLVVGVRMLDKHSLDLLKRPSTRFDFAVVAAVVATALASDLIIAAGVGLGLAILLFIRDQIQGSVIRRKTYGNQVSSKQRRLPAEMAALEEKGASIVACELQGSLFFGTTDQLFTELEADLKEKRFLILDMEHVQSVDFTAVHMLEQIGAQFQDRGGHLLFSGVPKNLPTGQNLRAYFRQLGLVKAGELDMFTELTDALEWCEDRLLEESGLLQPSSAAALDLAEIDLLKDMDDPDALKALRSAVIERSYQPGQKLFSAGETGDELFLMRRGMIRVQLPLGSYTHHVATFRRRDFFGEVAFLDRGARTAEAVAVTPTEAYSLSRKHFDEAAMRHPQLARQMFHRLAKALALRLRRTDRELQALQKA